MPMPEWLPRAATKRRKATTRRCGASAPKCGEVLYRRDLAANLYVCTRCGYHFRMSAYDRIDSIVDGEFTEIGDDVVSNDPLGWTDKKTYAAKLKSDREKQRALRIGRVRLCGDRRIPGRAWPSWTFTFAAARWDA